VFNSGDKWSGCAAKVHVLTQGDLQPEPIGNGAVARNGCRAGAGVSRGRSTESNEPANPDGLTTREGLNLAGRTRPSVVLSRSDEADRPSIWAAITMAEKEWLLLPLRIARNRRTRTRMYGGVGARRGNPPGDPIVRRGDGGWLNSDFLAWWQSRPTKAATPADVVQPRSSRAWRVAPRVAAWPECRRSSTGLPDAAPAPLR